MSIGQRIAELRNQKKISQHQLAKEMNISRQAVSKWENDLAAPDTLKLIQLADYLGTDVEYLATGVPPKQPPSSSVVTVDRIIEKIVERPVEVEKIVEVEKTVEIEKVVETIVEKPVIRKVIRVKYLRNPLEFLIAGFVGLLCGLLIGIMI